MTGPLEASICLGISNYCLQQRLWRILGRGT